MKNKEIELDCRFGTLKGKDWDDVREQYIKLCQKEIDDINSSINTKVERDERHN